MRIACPRCKTHYEIPDERLERGAVKVRCSSCRHVFAVRRRAERPAAAEEPTPAAGGQLAAGAEPPSPPEPPPEAAPETPADQAFADFGFRDLDTPAEESVPPSSAEQTFADFGFDDFGAPEAASGDRLDEEGREAGAVVPPAPESPADQAFADFGLKDLGAPAGGEEPEPAAQPEEARFEDFDFDHFGTEEPAEKPTGFPAAEEAAGTPDEDLELPSDDVMSSIGELDLGEFDDLEGSLDLGDTSESGGYLREPDEPLEQVRAEELVSARGRGGDVEVQGLAEEIPRLDIQRGPRRAEGATPSPLIARDRRRSPLFWVVLLAALGTGGYTAYNLYLHPEAFTFFSPSKIRALWQTRQMEAQLAVEDLSGYYQDLPGNRRVFIIQGSVANKSSGPRSLIRVRGNLFDAAGKTVASREVYCGNVLSETELATLPMETVDARLQNEVGQTLSNVDIAPASRVPFMVVFPSPPEGVEKFNVAVTEARRSSGS